MEVGAGKRSGGERTWQTFITGPLLGLRMAFSARRIKRERKGDLRDDEKEREKEWKREKRRERGIYHRSVYTLLEATKEKRRRVLYKEVEEEQHVTNHLYKGGERQGANTEFFLCSRWTLCACKSDNNFFFSFLLPPSPFLRQIIDEFLRVTRKGSCGKKKIPNRRTTRDIQ